MGVEGKVIGLVVYPLVTILGGFPQLVVCNCVVKFIRSEVLRLRV